MGQKGLEDLTFETFQKCVDLVRFWRSRTGKNDWDWPDSRDPEFQTQMYEAGIVSQDLEKSLVALAAYRSCFKSGFISVYQEISVVVHVLRNRHNKGIQRSHLIPDPVKEQFPDMTNPSGRLTLYPDSGEDNFKKLLGNLDDILADKTQDLTQGAIYFWDLDENSPEWFKEIVHSPEFERTTKLDKRVFYKEAKK